MSRERKLLFDASLVFVMGLLAAIFGYLIRVILSRQLSLEEFGLFYAVFTFVSFFIVFRDFGLGQALAKFIPQFLVKKEYGKIKASIKFAFFINLFMGMIFATFFIIFSDYLAINYFKNELAKSLLIILSAYFVLYAIYRLIILIFLGFQKSKIYSLNLFFINFFVFIGILIFKKFGVLNPAISYLFAGLMGIIFGFILLFKSFSYFKYVENNSYELKLKLFYYGFPILLASIGATFIGQIDTLLLIKFRTLPEVGIYNVVLPTAMLLITFGSALAMAMLPFVSEYWEKKKFKELSNILLDIYKKSFIIIAPIGLTLFIFSDLILKVLFGEYFISGSIALKILCIGSIFFSVAVINNNVLAAIGKPKEVTKLILFAALLNLIINLILIPQYGIIGAALATSASYFVVLILSTYLVNQSVKLKIPILDWIKIFFAGVAFTLLVNLFKNILEMNVLLETTVVLIIGLIGYFLILKIIGIDVFGLFRLMRPDFINHKI